ncbi:MAG: DUF2461 domain-containing protein [Anaerolineales bacterium]|jgi:uncharacterized protein (TIGR02453 family)
MQAKINFLPILNFLDNLSQNNVKGWFDSSRADYETARNIFSEFIDTLIDELRMSDNLQALSSKECVARIYRDIRFSRDKSPYHTNFSAIIAPGGRKSIMQGYYVSIQPHGQSLVAGGLYMPGAEQLERFRQAIAQHAATFKRITGAKDFVEQFGKIEGERLKTAPKGYDRSHPEIELLQLKQVTVLHHFPDQEVLAGDFPEKVVVVCRAMKPFLNYLDKVLQ